MKRKPPNPYQLSLFDIKEEDASSSSRDDISYLLNWGKEHGYPKLEFHLPSPYYGFNEAIIPEGESAWLHNIQHCYSSEWLRCAARTAREQEQREEKQNNG